MTSGNARSRDWKLRFEPRSRPFIEPLMGWTGCDDTLSQVELTFPSATAAIAYARRQGLRYLLQGADDPDTRPGSNAKAANTNSSSPDIRSADVCPWRLEWVERTLGLRGVQNKSGPVRGPAAYYASPQDVLDDHDLSPAQKRDVLRRRGQLRRLAQYIAPRGSQQTKAATRNCRVSKALRQTGLVLTSPVQITLRGFCLAGSAGPNLADPLRAPSGLLSEQAPADHLTRRCS